MKGSQSYVCVKSQLTGVQWSATVRQDFRLRMVNVFGNVILDTNGYTICVQLERLHHDAGVIELTLKKAKHFPINISYKNCVYISEIGA